MNKIENYLGIANHDIQMANNSQELKSYVASILYENDELQQENQKLHNKIDKAIETIEGWHFALDWAENDRLKIIKEILKDGNVDE